MKINLKGREASYNIINLIIAGVIIVIFIYSGIFSASENAYPVQCVHEKVSGLSCPSCGLSRSFSAMVRFDFEKASEFNTYGPRVFLFFVLQLVLRVSNILVLATRPVYLRKLALFDIAVSVITFLLAFWQFVEYNISLWF